jgi:Flp pilus assembly protein TadG
MRRDRRQQRGQVIAILALAMVVLIVGAGFVVDAGVAFASTRSVQNAADSGARAGALVLARKAAAGSTDPTTPSDWDEQVRVAVLAAAQTPGVTVTTKEYTDYTGAPLGVNVGTGVVPASAAGVRVVTNQRPGTFLIRVIGMTAWDVNQTATAVSGPSAGCQETSSCVTLPVTFPLTVYQCSGNNKTDGVVPPQEWAADQPITLPICGGNPGSVGWIDWTPPTGGTSEVVSVVQNPPLVPLPLPVWKYITQTGGISASGLEDALNAYAGDIVQVPIFDSTCPDTPTNDQLSGCLNPGGTGTQQWYHVIKLLSFRLDSPKGAYINGNNESVCGLNATQCLKGRFVSFITEGTVLGPCPGDCPAGTSFAVQLIK